MRSRCATFARFCGNLGTMEPLVVGTILALVAFAFILLRDRSRAFSWAMLLVVSAMLVQVTGWYAPPGVDLAAFGERGWL